MLHVRAEVARQRSARGHGEQGKIGHATQPIRSCCMHAFDFGLRDILRSYVCVGPLDICHVRRRMTK